MQPTRPPDPSAAIQTLAKAVDQLSGQVAALMAYVAWTAPSVPDDKVRNIQGFAQQMCPRQLSNVGAQSPALAASLAVEKIKSISDSLAAIRSAGSPPQSRGE